MWWIAGLVCALNMVIVKPSMAHEGGAIPADVWSHWNADWLLLSAMLTATYLYQHGSRSVMRTGWHVVAFAGGIAVLFVALISPLHVVSESLFAAHMIQHLLLVMVAPVLLVWSRPVAPLLRGLPASGRKQVAHITRIKVLQTAWERLTSPIVAAGLHVGALWLWHVPTLYSAAVNNIAIHMLEHATFFGTALLFWWMIRRQGDHGERVLAVFITMMATGLLGALMTFARSAWYTDHITNVGAWGLTMVEDQQLAGLLMWIPAGLVYVVVCGWLLIAWLNVIEKRVTERERRWTKELRDA
jgi:cytochrome c oxidase assembly factor CtaG